MVKLFTMEIESHPELQRGLQVELPKEAGPSPSSSLGWPFGLPTCIAIHTPTRPPNPGSSKPGSNDPHDPPSLVFHQQFTNLQTTFLLPLFSRLEDDDDHASSTSSSSSSSSSSSPKSPSSSFCKDSRRITLGSLIGLPMDHSFHALHPDAHYHVFPSSQSNSRSRNFLPSCGILSLLGCTRNSNESASTSADEDHRELAIEAVATVESSSLAAYLHSNRIQSDCCVPGEGGGSDCVGSGSPDWNGQFVSCHSVLTEGEWTGRALEGDDCVIGGAPVKVTKSEETGSENAAASSSSSSSRYQSKSGQRMQRSASMKSFFSSICSRIDAVK